MRPRRTLRGATSAAGGRCCVGPRARLLWATLALLSLGATNGRLWWHGGGRADLASGFKELASASGSPASDERLLSLCLEDAACYLALHAATSTHAAAAHARRLSAPDGSAAPSVVAATAATAPETLQPSSSRVASAEGGGHDDPWLNEPAGLSARLPASGTRADVPLRSLPGGVGGDAVPVPATAALKAAAAVVLLLEALGGMYLPLAFQRLQSPQWWLSLLNCFSGGIFLAAGLIHLLPHCEEAQARLGPIGPNGDYPLYLVLVVVGYCLVFFVERVLFDVHGEGHTHCQHSNVFSHSKYYTAMSHGSKPHRRGRPSHDGPDGAANSGRASCGICGHHGHHTHGHDAHSLSPDPLALLPPPAPPPAPAVAASGANGAPLRQQPTAGQASEREKEQQPGVLTAEALAVLALGAGAGAQQQQQQQQQQQRRRYVTGSPDGSEAAPAAAQPEPGDDDDDDDAGLGHSHSHGHDHDHGHDHSHGHHLVHHHSHGDGAATARRPRRSEGMSESSGLLLTAAEGGEDEDAASCHSTHAPRAVCICVDAQEAAQRGDEGGGGYGVDDKDGGVHAPLLAASERAAAGEAHGGHHHGHDSDERGGHHHHHHHHHGHHGHHHGRRHGGSRGASPDAPGHADAHAHAHELQAGGGPGHDHSHGHDHPGHVAHSIRPRFRFMHGAVLLAALALHTALECMALGLMAARSDFVVLFAAIASHKAVSALALSSRFLKEGATIHQVTMYVGPFCLVAPLSILAGAYIGTVAPLASLVLSCFATGTFIYVGASEVIMEEFEGEMRADRRDISTRTARYVKFSAVLAAVAVVATITLVPDDAHH